MGLYGNWARFGQRKFGTSDRGHKFFGNTILGFLIRRQIGHTLIYRVRRGNGYYGSALGQLIQDKYAYFVPSSINNAQGQTARNALAQATLNWQTVLTEEQKAEYNRRAMIKSGLSGYNLYVGEYVEANA
jgi:hypothetical protein